MKNWLFWIVVIIFVLLFLLTGQSEGQALRTPAHLASYDLVLYADYECDCWRIGGPSGEVVYIDWRYNTQYLLPQDVTRDDGLMWTAGGQVFTGRVTGYPKWTAVAVTHGWDEHCQPGGAWITFERHLSYEWLP